MFSLKAEAAAEALQNTTEGTSIKRFKHNNEETHVDTDYTALAIRVANIEASDTQHRCRLDASAQRIKAVATGVEIAHHNTKSTSSGSSSNVATFSSEMSTPSKSSTCVNKSSLSRAGRSIRSGKVERQLAAAAEELRLRSMPNEFIGADGLRHVPPAVNFTFFIFLVAFTSIPISYSSVFPLSQSGSLHLQKFKFQAFRTLQIYFVLIKKI